MVVVCSTLAIDGREALGIQPVEDRLAEQLRLALNDADIRRSTLATKALRELRDPTLEPLFAHLASSDRPGVRAQAIIALAEVSEDRRLDLLLVRSLPGPGERGVVLREAFELNLLDRQQIADVGGWAEMDQALALLMLAELERTGWPVPIASWEALLDSERLGVRAAAMLHVLQRADEVEPDARPSWERALLSDDPDAPLSGVLRLEDTARREELTFLLDHVRRGRLDRAVPFVLACAEEFAPPDGAGRPSEVWYETLHTLLAVAPDHPRTRAIWVEARGHSTEPERALRLGLVAMELSLAYRRDVAARLPAARAPGWVHDDLSVMPHRIVSVIAEACVGAERGDAEPIEDLVRTGSTLGSEWALRCAETMDDTGAIAVLGSIVDVSCGLEGDGAWGVRRPLLSRGARLLADLDADRLTRTLADADSECVVAALEGMLASDMEVAAGIASEVAPERGPARAMADILTARCGGAIEATMLERLDAIALGAGRLDRPRRLQAAWLALRHRGLEMRVFSKILPDPG
jgi:hypothetical protein